MLETSPVYVHGSKHLVPAYADFLVRTVNSYAHDVIVDPFAGSCFFEKHDLRAREARLNIVGVSAAGIFEILSWLNPHYEKSSYHGMHANDFIWEEYGTAYKNTMLFLDPPRGDSVQYDSEWTKEDEAIAVCAAVMWPGPVIVSFSKFTHSINFLHMAGFQHDVVSIDTEDKIIDRLIDEVVDGVPIGAKGTRIPKSVGITVMHRGAIYE